MTLEHLQNIPVQNNNGPPPLPSLANPKNQPENDVADPPFDSTRPLKLDVWPHSTRLFIHGILKAKCNYCKKVLGGKSTNGTSHLRTHMNNCVHKQIHDGSQRILGPNYKVKGKTELSANQFSNEVSTKELYIMILMYEYSLSIVDHLLYPNPSLYSPN